jgi:hypothetical protein
MTLNKDDEDGGIVIYKQLTNSIKESLRILKDGIRLMGGDNNHVLTSNASTIDITEYAKKTELPTVPTKVSQLTNDSNFITANSISDRYLAFKKELKTYSEDSDNIMTISHTGINFNTNINDVDINENGFFVSKDSDGTNLCSFTTSGIKFADKTSAYIPTANGTFINFDESVLKKIAALEARIAALEAKHPEAAA